MKNVLLCTLAFGLALSSCKKEEHHEQIGKTFTASINLNLNGVTDQGSMTKSDYLFGQDAKDLYAIEIKNSDSEVIAGGLFTGAFLFTEGNSLEVSMEHGKQYSVEATLVIGSENVNYSSNEIDPVKFGAPFSLINQEKVGAMQSSANCSLLTGSADWTNTDKMCQFVDLSSQTDWNIEYVNKEENLIPGDRWYYKTNMTADYQNSGITIALRRVSAKLIYRISNLNSSFSVKSYIYVGIQASPITFNIVDNEEMIFTMPDITTAYTKLIANEDYEVDSHLNLSVYDQVAIKSSDFETKLKANHYYHVNFDADLNKANGISITTNDSWQTDQN